MKKNRQREILESVAASHGLTNNEAEEIWKLFTNKIHESISEQDKMEDGLYMPERFKVIHIDNFGKFIPNYTNIKHANYCLAEKKENEET
jgi:hypothetical protein